MEQKEGRDSFSNESRPLYAFEVLFLLSGFIHFQNSPTTSPPPMVASTRKKKEIAPKPDILRCRLVPFYARPVISHISRKHFFLTNQKSQVHTRLWICAKTFLHFGSRKPVAYPESNQSCKTASPRNQNDG